MRPARPLTILFPLAALAAVMLLVHAARPTRADENKKNELKRDIESQLSNIASELRDVPGDSSTSDLERTFGYADTIYDKARELKEHAEGDSDARRMADYYPDYARRYRDAARYLKEMKGSHRRLDELPRKCEDTMKELASRLRAFTDSHDPRGVDEVPRLARELGKVGKDALEQAERTRNEQATFYDRIDDFSDSDGKWSDVRSNLHGAGRAILEHVQRQHEQMKRDDVCGNLAKEERNPLVEEAMRKLFEGKKGIELLYESMDRQLAEMAGYLDGLVGDSNASDIQSAERKLDEVERSLEQLDRIKGNDGEAKRRVETWRNIVRAGREGMKHLRTLKEAQFRADKAPERCREAATRVNDAVARMVASNKEASATRLQALGRSIAEPIKAGLAKTDEQHAVMERALSDAQRFDPSEGRWREVTAKTRASATAIFEYWKRAREAAHSACDDLAKGDQSSVVREGLEKIKAGAGGLIDGYRRDVQTWSKDADSLFQMDCTELEAIWLAMCGADEERNESPDRDEARATAREIGNRMKGRVDPMLVRYADLKKRGEELVSADETKEAATALLKSMDEKFAKFARIQSGGALRGADHPMSQYAAEHGKQMHDDYASRYSCNVYDQPYPDAGGRPDCIVVGSTCYVYEFKPDTRKAKENGKEQLRRYVPAVTKFYQRRIDNKEGNDSSLQGRITSEVERRCVSGGQVDFKSEVIPYPLCEKKYECTR
ncbi:MAG: hypothetical protein F9K40_00110 [Kofleriaceae bacterium]|nr:MAG: hypothetical protein F9K40_00110 [Kofleriaceae bacterium]MBZ0234572.1 hypothetical protein [Kofleriaceae bacterium]